MYGSKDPSQNVTDPEHCCLEISANLRKLFHCAHADHKNTWDLAKIYENDGNFRENYDLFTFHYIYYKQDIT